MARPPPGAAEVVRMRSALLFLACVLQSSAFILPSTSVKPYRAAPHPKHGRRTAAPIAMASDGLAIHTADDLACFFAGGAFGVMGSLLALEYKKLQMRQRSHCPYCKGRGRLTCALCCGTGVVQVAVAGQSQMTVADCPLCSGKGETTCINCKGDGRLVPLMLDRRASRDPEDELEEIGMG